ncbi:polysaccharide biosynthesis protein [Allosphingosinicella sp.]|jgi:FlaA1/EpsC-like NDP-sugar epimerase|uniref:polysaccharide biosynthesis protein n=1 Tax=Allosphingosinicella sp. TaxID=2823234 RepID=UPI002F202B97
MILDFVRRLTLLSRARKRTILIAYDLAAMGLALWGAFSTRLGEFYFPTDPLALGTAALSILIGTLGLYHLQVYHIVLRYFDLRVVGRILLGSAIAATAWVILVYFTRPAITVDGLEMMVPRSVGFIYGGFLFMLLFMGRYAMALMLAAGRRDGDRTSKHCRNIAIYGANASGISLANSVRADAAFRLCGFIDDDGALHGQIVAGVPVYSPKALADMAQAPGLDEVFLAMPQASRSQRLAAIARLTEHNIQVKTIPAPEELVSGRFTVTDVRPINVSDLLRRDPVQPLNRLIGEAVEGRCILITGAGGSIGSEICRQILRAKPAKLVLLDHSEFALYAIEQQLIEARARLPEGERPEIAAVVGSMLSEFLIKKLLRAHDVDTVYHAAAYKHVPLLEQNEVVGVENNVLGTWVLAKAALDAKLTRFTMISTDKAVRPKSVMGASKRVAELIVQAFADDPSCETRFGIVRFGNVLDSSGSVVQRFRSQIRHGGPVTVTHREITRFFMSIPEATQLVLQASALARNGEVFVLDMGEPVKIADLARHMISLSGMTVRDDQNPGGDIAIEYVGLRPGEKLYEELFVGEETLETAHPRIRMAKERFIAPDELVGHIRELRAAVASGDSAKVRAKLGELIEPDQGALERVEPELADRI